MAQLDHFVGGGPTVYLMVAGGIAIICLLPRVTKAVPPPLVAIVTIVVFTHNLAIGVL